MPRSGSADLDAQPHPGGGVTVLVVDDQHTVRRVLHRTLRLKGFAVIEAPDAASALTILGTGAERIQIVLTDDGMPGMSGRELAGIVARVYPSVRIILMSGDSGVTDVEARGAVLLPKPFSTQALIAALRRALSGEPDA
jgi:DNA-binding NtrC family response regulator